MGVSSTNKVHHPCIASGVLRPTSSIYGALSRDLFSRDSSLSWRAKAPMTPNPRGSEKA